MGSSLCDGGPGLGSDGISTSDIYLSNPQNLTHSQIRRSADNKITSLTGSYLGPDTSLILGCKQDQNRQLLNKYYLTFLYFLRNKTGDPEIEIKDFGHLLNILDEDKEFTAQIKAIQTEYPKKATPKDKAEFLIGEYFKNGFFSSAIEKFPIYSSDPSILGYVRRPLVDLNKGIKSKYEKQGKKKQIYCVIQVSKEEQKLLQKLAQKEDNFTFTTFVRCFSSEEKAKKRQKQLDKIGKDIRESHKIVSTTIFLNIEIPNLEIDKEYDFGFYQEESQKDNPQGDIIMNIMNFFQVTGSEPQNKTYDLKYNALARLIHMKRERMLSNEPQLLKVTTLIEGQVQEIKSHSNLIRLVANRRLSITASQTLKKSYGLKENMEDNERINLIEAYLQEKNYDKALQECSQKTTPQFSVRKAQIFYQSKKYQQATAILTQLQPSKKQLKTTHFKEYVLFQFMSAKLKKLNGQGIEAKKQLQSLSDAMKQEYRGSYEYRAREVERELHAGEGGEGEVKWERWSEGLNVGVLLSH